MQSLQVRCPGSCCPPTRLMALITAKHMETWEEETQGQQLIVNLPLVFHRPGFLSKTEGACLGGGCFDAACVTDESLKAVAEMSHSSDPLYVH